MFAVVLPWTLLIVGSYLIGSIPSGYLAGRCCGVDLRAQGSGNIGATNALRVLGKPWGYAVFLTDFVKGFGPVLLANQYSVLTGTIHPASAPAAAAALCVLLGNNFPVWLGFKGGKGIACSAGVIVGLFPAAIILVMGIWLLTFTITRYVSVASMAASIALPLAVMTLFLLHRCDWLSVLVSIVMGALALWRHRGNIFRLRAGTEPRFEKSEKNPKSSKT